MVLVLTIFHIWITNSWYWGVLWSLGSPYYKDKKLLWGKSIFAVSDSTPLLGVFGAVDDL